MGTRIIQRSGQDVSWLNNKQLTFTTVQEGPAFHGLGIANADGSNYYDTGLDGTYGGVKCSPTEPLIAVNAFIKLILFAPKDGSTKEVKMDTFAGHMGANNMSWSPDGKYLAQTSWQGDRLHVLTRNGEMVRFIETKRDSFHSVSWNYRSTILAYDLITSSGTTMVNLEGKTVNKIENCLDLFFNPRQDGYVYIKNVGIDYGGADYALIVKYPGGKEFDIQYYIGKQRMLMPKYVRWSPNGKKLLFDGYVANGWFKSKKAWLIYDMESKKSTPIKIEDSAIDLEKLNFPAWSPDSSQIAFVDISNDFHITILSV